MHDVPSELNKKKLQNVVTQGKQSQNQQNFKNKCAPCDIRKPIDSYSNDSTNATTGTPCVIDSVSQLVHSSHIKIKEKSRVKITT